MKPQHIPNVKTLIVIPCLNEARTIDDLLLKFSSNMNHPEDRIIVADGGSTDGTRDIVASFSTQDPRVLLLANPKRIQSAGINLAIEMFGAGYDYLIRIDAHGDYPDDYCHRLLEDAVNTGADSVVVAMDTVGHGTFQKATAIAQNSKLGNGGSKHREGAKGHWIDHGHHALMRISAFTTVGGYDESFSHNEDAELDYRLRKAGFRIWMTDKTRMTYYPRSNVRPLFKQYLAYGRGRAKNLLKHRSLPKVRQMIPLAVMPVAMLALFGVFHWAAAIPLCLWIAACLGYGLWMAIAQKIPLGPLAAFSAMVMHFAWSTGFWLELASAISGPCPGGEKGYVMNTSVSNASSEGFKVDIGICTYRRPAVVATLKSLFELDVPPGVHVRLIVADNDAEPSAQASIDRLRDISPFEITYIHCPKSNISIARNACLSECKADYLAFIDDDETAPREWLSQLLKTAQETSAEAVLGPVTAIYKSSAPGWMRRGDFHSTFPVWVNGEIITGYTCNTLLRMNAPSVAGRRFALSLGQSGGEDTHFFTHMHADGGRIAYAEHAVLSEPVPDTRASFMWLAKRRFRSGQTHGRLLAEQRPGIRRVAQVAIAACKVVACAGLALLTVLDPVRRNKQLLRMALHIGSVSGAVGVREIRQYGAVEAT